MIKAKITDFLYICQHYNDNVELVSRALPEVASIIHPPTKHMITEETPKLEAFLQVQASDCQWRAATHAARFSASLFT